MRLTTRLAAAVLCLAAAFALASCGGSDEDNGDQQATESEAAESTEGGSAAPAGAADSKVSAKLGEYFIKPDASSVDAGNIEFDVTNDGSIEHEFVVIKTDTPAADLPLADDGNVDEEAAGEVPGEIGSVQPGATETVTLSLDAGKYVLICNLPGHYKAGQYAEFSVR